MPDHGPSNEMWEKMVAFAKDKGWKGGDYKKLNRPFENRLLGKSFRAPVPTIVPDQVTREHPAIDRFVYLGVPAATGAAFLQVCIQVDLQPV
jgi:hypothetical protein